MKLQIKSYRKKGINAYLVRADRPMSEAMYGQPIEGDKEKAHKSKLHTVEIDLSALKDGIYKYKEAGGADFNKSRYYWIEVKDGEIIREGEGNPPPASADFMPPLEGTERQVSWAASIRSKAAAKHGAKLAKYVATKTSATWWIDNRSKL